jgi:hypothetical protein
MYICIVTKVFAFTLLNNFNSSRHHDGDGTKKGSFITITVRFDMNGFIAYLAIVNTTVTNNVRLLITACILEW